MWLAVLVAGMAIANVTFGWRMLNEPVFSAVVELGQDVETGLDTEATIYCAIDPPDVCKVCSLRDSSVTRAVLPVWAEDA